MRGEIESAKMMTQNVPKVLDDFRK